MEKNFKLATPNIYINSCRIFDESLFNLKIVATNSLLIVDLNISSFQKHIDKLYEMLYSLSNKPDIICISETRIADLKLINISIPRYKFLHKNSPSIVEGVGVYICQNLKYDLTNNYKLYVTGVEELYGLRFLAEALL